MSLKDALKVGPPPTHPGKVCSIGEALRDLPTAESAALRAMLEDPAWSNPAIHRAMTAEGIVTNKSRVGHHRRGDCSCQRMGIA